MPATDTNDGGSLPRRRRCRAAQPIGPTPGSTSPTPSRRSRDTRRSTTCSSTTTSRSSTPITTASITATELQNFEDNRPQWVCRKREPWPHSWAARRPTARSSLVQQRSIQRESGRSGRRAAPVQLLRLRGGRPVERLDHHERAQDALTNLCCRLPTLMPSPTGSERRRTASCSIRPRSGTLWLCSTSFRSSSGCRSRR